MAIRRVAGETRPVCIYGLNDDGVPITTGTPVVFELLDGTGAVVAGPLVATPGGTQGNDWCADLTTPRANGVYTLRATVTVESLVEVEEVPFIVGVAGAGTTRRELRRRIGRRLGDLLLLTADTSEGSRQVLRDLVHLTREPKTLAGREAYVNLAANAVNQGQTRTIENNSRDTASLTLMSPLPAAIFAGDEVEVFDTRGLGWRVEEVHAAIDQRLSDAFPRVVAPTAPTVLATWNASSMEIPLPAAWEFVGGLEVADHDGLFRPLPFAAYRIDPHAWTAMILSPFRWSLDGAVIRAQGFGPHPPLTDDDDTTRVDAEWLVAACCSQLLLAGMVRHATPERERLVAFWDGQEKALRRKIGTRLPPSSVRRT